MPARAGLKQKAGVNSNVFLREFRELARILLAATCRATASAKAEKAQRAQRVLTTD